MCPNVTCARERSHRRSRECRRTRRGQGRAQGEPGLRGAGGSFACCLYRVALPTCAFTRPAQHPCAITWGASSLAREAAAGLRHRGGDPHGCTPCFRASPASPIPEPTQGTRSCAVRRMRCHLPRGKKRATVPKVPRPWMELNGPLFPSKPRPAKLARLPSEGLEQRGRLGCCRAVPAPRRCPAAPGTEGLARGSRDPPGKRPGPGHGSPGAAG